MAVTVTHRSKLPMSFFEDGICRAYKSEPTKAMNIECLMVLDRPIERSVFRAILLNRGLSYGRMRSRVAVNPRGQHVFEELDPATIVDALLHEKTLHDATWCELQALLSRELLKPWPADLPHWEVHIVRGLRRSAELPGDTALFFRLDHACGDGFALKNWLMSMTDEINPNSLKSLWTESTDHLPQLLSQRVPSTAVAKSQIPGIKASSLMVWGVLKTVFFQILLMIPAIWIAVVESELDDTVTNIKWDEKRHTKTMHKEIRISREYTLDSVREVAKSMSTPSKRCTVNDIVMGLVAGGLRGYLEKVEDPAICSGRSCRLRAIMVTSLREQIRSNKVEFANVLTFLPIPLPVDKPELQGRVRKIKSYIDFLKMSPAPWLILRLQQVLVFLLGPAALQWKINRTQRKQTLCISNLPGPLTPVSICGAKISRIGFWVNPSNMPLMLSVLTYAGSISIMALIDPQVVSDADGLMESVEKELSANLSRAPHVLSRPNSNQSMHSQCTLSRNGSVSSLCSIPEDRDDHSAHLKTS